MMRIGTRYSVSCGVLTRNVLSCDLLEKDRCQFRVNHSASIIRQNYNGRLKIGFALLSKQLLLRMHHALISCLRVPVIKSTLFDYVIEYVLLRLT